jgi:Asp-tRNA(Asn)/Glu-tRNA(Gln) amidotransferase C subunit
MSDTKPTEQLRLFPEEALADIRTLARFALQSGEVARMKRDLEMILTIVEIALPLNKRSQTPRG